MKKFYEEPIVNISAFDSDDDIITLSGISGQSMSSEEQAVDAIAGENSSVSVYSVNVKSN